MKKLSHLKQDSFSTIPKLPLLIRVAVEMHFLRIGFVIVVCCSHHQFHICVIVYVIDPMIVNMRLGAVAVFPFHKQNGAVGYFFQRNQILMQFCCICVISTLM